MKLKEYILEYRKTTYAQAARELGYTREHIRSVADGTPAGKVLAFKIEGWSKGSVQAKDVMFPDRAV